MSLYVFGDGITHRYIGDIVYQYRGVCVFIVKYYATDINSQGEIVQLFKMHLYSESTM